MLTSARKQYREQRKIADLAVKQARRRSGRGPRAVAAVIATYQLESAANAFAYAPEILAEQGIAAPSEATARLSSVVTGAAALPMLEKLATAEAMDRLVKTLVNDASRTAATIDLGRRPAVTGYVRSLSLPSCSRCVVLAGRVYWRSTGFQRHPNCDCTMTPTTQEIGPELVIDPHAAVESGQVRGLSKADKLALDEGGSLNRIVNVRKRSAGLTIGSSVVERGGKLTPAGIMMRAGDDRRMALALLREHGYLY